MKNFYKAFLVSFFIGLLAFSYTNATAQQSVILLPQKDNTIYESESGTTSNGAGSYLFAGRTAAKNGNGLIRRALLHFNIAENIPAGATIDSVKLTLRMSKSTAGTLNATLHRVLHDWGEGTSDAASNEGGGANATTDDATWQYAFFDTSQWTQLGGDYDPAALATRGVGGTGFYTWGPDEEMRQDVQSWLDNPAGNFGWMIRGDESTPATAKRFDSKENTTSANRPKLTVYYTPDVASVAVRREDIPQSFALDQNYPNPFNPSTRIDFDVAQAGNIIVTVHNVLGQKVNTLFSGYLAPNSYTLEWDGKNSAREEMPTGFYFYVLQTETLTSSRKMLLIR